MASKKQLQKTLAHMLKQQARFGQSKHQAKQEARTAYLKEHGNLRGYNPSRVDGIFSYSTMNTYTRASQQLASWLHDNGIKNARDVTQQNIADYLRSREAQGLSAWTVSRDMAAANKIFNFELSKKDIGLRERKQEDITRSRNAVKGDSRDTSRWDNQKAFSYATGARRNTIERLEARQIIWNNGRPVAVHFEGDKGGKDRYAPILNSEKERVQEILQSRGITEESARDNPNLKIFSEKYDNHIDNHALRGDYACALMRQLEQERSQGQELCQGDFVIPYRLNPRDDRESQYKGHDRDICGMVSAALGHNRLEILGSYTYKL